MQGFYNFSADSGNVAAAASLVPGTKKDAAYLEDKELARSQSATEAVAKKAAHRNGWRGKGTSGSWRP